MQKFKLVKVKKYQDYQRRQHLAELMDYASVPDQILESGLHFQTESEKLNLYGFTVWPGFVSVNTGRFLFFTDGNVDDEDHPHAVLTYQWILKNGSENWIWYDVWESPETLGDDVFFGLMDYLADLHQAEDQCLKTHGLTEFI